MRVDIPGRLWVPGLSNVVLKKFAILIWFRSVAATVRFRH
jgi:hypothetical protein